jgi:hypothetical protein
MTTRARCILVAATLVAAVACGDSPNGPGPTPPPPPPPVNTPPVVEGIEISATRVEVNTDVTLTASVRDADTPPSQLTFEWSADGGTFTGQGATVTWKAPTDRPTPADYVIRLAVVERYTGQGGLLIENRGTGSSNAIRVHDSVREMSDLVMTFLTEFASSTPPDVCVRNFSSTACAQGRADELADVIKDRRYYQSLGSRVRIANVTFDQPRLRSNVTAPCEFTSRVVECEPGVPNCRVGDVGTSRGDCLLTGVYEQQRWWLCTSNFRATSIAPGFRFFPGR